ncbi:MAG: replication-associated recombination protein A [Planctomycetes bacterium]|nr:replication-associated recombination protein A [Planctomycetota bacterium]
MFNKRAKQLAAEQAPLAERLRPREPADFVGQSHLVGAEGALYAILNPAPGATPTVRNMILWGPPGTGKTTLARMLAQKSGLAFETLSATSSGVKDVRELLDRARARLGAEGKATLVFIDEIHRFNKAQQDSLLHASEDGLITLIGATTENPSFEVNAALLSRCRVHVLKPLDEPAMDLLIDRALAQATKPVTLAEEGRSALRRYSGGDARRLLMAVEAGTDMLAAMPEGERVLTGQVLERALGERRLRYDKAGDEHYDMASALIKSVRGSDPHAAIYYAMRMLAAGEDPKFVVRRLAILASEDIGNADPGALNLAASAIHVVHFIGLPEAEYTICQLASYLALAPKSNSAARARMAAHAVIEETGELPVPLNIRNAPTRLMKELGYGKGYNYAHDFEGGFSPEAFLPDKIAGRKLYEPADQGFEQRLKARLAELEKRIADAKATPQ